MEDPVKVSTTRFGELQVSDSEIIEFQEGVLGFEKLHKFFIVDPGDSSLIIWLQSTTDPSIAFPIIEPKIFKNDYQPKLLPIDLKSIDLESQEQCTIYCILTIPSNLKQMSANLKAPIVINNAKNIARQIVLQDNKLSVNFEMYDQLRSFLIMSPVSDDSKRTQVEQGHTPQPTKNTAEKANKTTTESTSIKREQSI